MSTDGQGTKCRRKIAENYNCLTRVHERYRRRTGDSNSEREIEFMFAKNQLGCTFGGNLQSGSRFFQSRLNPGVKSNRGCLPILVVYELWRCDAVASVSERRADVILTMIKSVGGAGPAAADTAAAAAPIATVCRLVSARALPARVRIVGAMFIRVARPGAAGVRRGGRWAGWRPS